MTKTIVIGNLGKDAVVNEVGGKKVINFSLAHTETWKDASGNQQSKTTWFDVARWTDKTGVAQYLTKGTQVYVEGKVDVKTYSKSDGSVGASLVLNASEIQLLGGRSNQQVTATPATAQENTVSDVLDSLPF